MSGYTALRRPITNDQWARDVEDRLQQLMNPTTARIGPWVLSTSADGILQATRPGAQLVAIEGTIDNVAAGTTDVVTVPLTGGVANINLEDLLAQARDFTLQQLLNVLSGQLPGADDILKGLDSFFKINLVDWIIGNRIPQIPTSWITDVEQELLVNGNFDTAESVADNPDWFWDSTVGRNTPLGSVRTNADGHTKTLQSGPKSIPVVLDDKINVSVYAAWDSLASTGTPIQLRMAEYGDTGDYLGSVLIDQKAASGTNAIWQELSGQYQPSNASVKSVRVELVVASTATAGKVWFDTSSARKTGLIKIDLIGGLQDALNQLTAFGQNIIDNVLTGLKGVPVVGGLASELQTQFSSTMAQINSAASAAASALSGLLGKLDISTWTSHLNTLLTNPASILGNLPTSSITGLDSALAAGGQALRDAIVQALTGTSGTGHTDADVIAALTAIPATAVKTAITGAANIESAIQQAIDSVVSGSGGNTGGTGFGFLDMISQLTGLRNAAAGANAAAVNVQAQLAGLDPAASSEVVNFGEFTDAASPPSMFTKVNDTGSGSLVTSGGLLIWSGTSAGREFYLYNGGPLQTDLFEVTFVLPQVPSHGWFGADGANYLYLIGRSDSTGSNMVLCRLSWREIRFFSYNTGTFTQLGPTLSQNDIITGGCSVSFKGGTVAEPRYFETRVNGTKVLNFTESSPVSLYGASYRFAGLGVEKGSSYDTGKISTWSMLDGGASAGSGVVAGYTAAGLTNLNIWKGTAAEYAAISSKSANTIYFVKN